MAIVTIPGGMCVPMPHCWQNPGPSISPNNGTHVINASGEKIAVIFPVPRTGTLDKFEFCLGTVTTTPTNGIRVSFQDVDASGNPDGTQDQFRDYGTALVSNTWIVPDVITDDGTNGGVKRSVTQGDLIACVIEFPSYVDGAFFLMCSNATTVATSAQIDHKIYQKLFTTSWGNITFEEPFFMALKYDDGTYAFISPNVQALTGITSTTFQAATNPDERGMRFIIPFDCEINGVWIRSDLDTANLTGNLTVYDSADNVLAQVSIDPDMGTWANQMFNFAPISITGGQVYRATLTVTSSPSGATFYEYNVPTNDIIDTFGGGKEWYLTTRNDGGAWTDTTTQRPLMGIRISGVETGGGGGGGAHSYVFGA